MNFEIARSAGGTVTSSPIVGCLLVGFAIIVMTSTPAFGSIGKNRRPMIQSQLAEAALLLRTTQNPGNLSGNDAGKLMNLCKVIGQSQVLLLQMNTKNLSAKKKKRVDTSLEQSITDLNQACDGGNSITTSLEKAWILTGKVQRRLTMLSKSLQSGGSI
jgi:hypothetical protein